MIKYSLFPTAANLLLTLLCIVVTSFADECTELAAAHQSELPSLILKFPISTSKCLIRLEPVVLWAQNMDFLFVKLRHSLTSDSPSCADTYLVDKNTFDWGFNFSSLCIESGHVILYSLQVRTFKSLNHHYCRWKTQQISNVILECLKSPNPYFWPRLTGQPRPDEMQSGFRRRVYHWWDIYKQYFKQVQNYLGLLELRDEIDQDSEVRTMRNNTVKTKSYKLEPEPVNYYCKPGSPYYLGSWL